MSLITRLAVNCTPALFQFSLKKENQTDNRKMDTWETLSLPKHVTQYKTDYYRSFISGILRIVVIVVRGGKICNSSKMLLSFKRY